MDIKAVHKIFNESARTIEQCGVQYADEIIAAGKDMISCFEKGGKILICGNGGMSELVSIKTGSKIRAGMSLVKAVTEIPFKWSVYCAVMGRTETGQEYTKAFQVVTETACTQYNLANQLNQLHQDFVKDEISPRHIVNVGWLADPHGNEWDEAQAEAIFRKMGAFDGAAQWQMG